MHKDKNSAMNSEAANYAKQQIIMADAEIKIAGLRVFVARHTLYHVSQSLVLGLLLALYGVRIFANDDLDGRSKCANGDTDVTGLVRAAFKACFFVHAIDFLNSSVLGPYFRMAVPLSQQAKEDLNYYKTASD